MTVRRQLAVAAAVGAVMGALVIVELRLVGLGVLTVVAVASLVALWARGGDRLTGMAWSAAAFTAPLNGVRVASFMALSDMFLVLAVAAMLPSIRLRRPSLGVSPQVGVLVGLAFIATGGAVGTLFADRPGASLLAMAKFVLAAAGSLMAVALWAPGRRQVRTFVCLWLAGAVTSALWALALAPKQGRPSGLATHPNHLGVVCLIGVGIALGLATSGRRWPRGFGLASCPVLVAALLSSGSRAAVVGLLAMVAVVAALSYRVQLAVRAVAVAAVFAVAVLLGLADVPAGSGLDRLLGEATSAASDTGRTEHLARTLDRFSRHPVTGEGFEFAQEAHNIYLQVLVAAGPLGLIGLVVVARSVLAAAWAGIRACSGPVTGDRALLAGLAGGYAGYLVAGLFQNALWDRYLWLYVAAALALASDLRSGAASDAGRREDDEVTRGTSDEARSTNPRFKVYVER